MGRPGFTPQRWQTPSPLGYGSALDSVGTVAAPLLAGFSLASVVVISDDADHFRWPGAAALGLTVAAVLFIGAVQCAYSARQYLWSADDASQWWPEMKKDSETEALLAGEQSESFQQWESWASWTRWTYNCGILALLIGLGFALPPQDKAGQMGLRWAAVGVAFAACIAEVVWIILSTWRRSAEARRNGRES